MQQSPGAGDGRCWRHKVLPGLPYGRRPNLREVFGDFKIGRPTLRTLFGDFKIGRPTLRTLFGDFKIGRKGLSDKLKDEHDDVFLRSSRAFEDFCRLAGEKELADKVRPSEERPGRRQQDPPEGQEAPGEEASEESPSQQAVDASSEGVESTTENVSA